MDITNNTETGNNWKLWIYAEDILGNSQIVSSDVFWLDNTKPTLEVTQDTILTENVVKNTDVEIKITENHSRLNDTTNSYQYYLSTSADSLTSEDADSIYGVPQSLVTYTLNQGNDNDVRTATINIGSTETGTRYLFVKTVKDNMGNESIQGGTIVEIGGINYHRFGPYEFDNLPPRTVSFNPEENTTPAQSQSVIVTIEDQGQAGLNASSFKYLWIQSNTQPTTESFDTAYESATHKGTFTNGGTVTIDTETGNDWYLWISAEDNFGHRYVDGTGAYYLDNTKPTITATPDTNPANGENQNVVKNIDVTLTYADPLYGANNELAGIRENNTYEYYLSTSNTELVGGTLVTINPAPTGDSYVKTATINIGSGETGVRYLFIRTIFDNAGNESGETKVTSGAANYQLVGTYIFDNTAPVVSFNPNGDTATWKLEQASDVTVQDNSSAASVIENASGDITANTNQGTGVAGVKTSTVKYRWIQGTGTVLTVENFANGEERAYTTRDEVLETITETITSTEPGEVGEGRKTGDNWYLWIYAEDNLGNASVTRTANPFKIDNTLPTISVSPESAEVCKSTNITIIAADIGSGLNTSNEYKAYLSESSEDLINQQEIGYTSGETIQNVGSTITGWRYLFVKTVKDNVDLESEKSGTIVTASDGNKYHVYGPYIFDNTAPSVEFNPNGNPTWQKEHTTTVTIKENPYTVDAAVETMGEAGINKDALKYVWRKEADGVPTKDQITETLVIDGTSETTDNEKGTTIQIQRLITKNTDSDNDWKLWIYVEDILGNSNIVGSEKFWLDNTNPTLEVAPTPIKTTDANVWTDVDIEIKITETHSKLDDNGNSYQYYLSTSADSLTSEAVDSIYGVPQSLTTYTLNEGNENDVRTASINVGGTETGTRYLFIKTVKDKTVDEQNESIGGTIVTIDGTNYHRFGPYEFDNLSPIVSFNPEKNEQNDTSYEKSQSTVVTLTERGEADFNVATFKYLWTQTNTAPTAESFDTAYESATHKGSFVNAGTVTIDTETGNDWYLWISAEDNLGNRLVQGTGTFWLDNTKPTVDVTNIVPEVTTAAGVWQNADITITVTEEHAKLKADSIKYYLSTSDNALTSEEEGSPYGEPQVLNELSLDEANSTVERHATISNLGWNSEDKSKTDETGVRYLFVLAEEDNAGNISSEYGTLVEITEGPYPGTYHRFGPYVFDNAPPQVVFDPDGSPIITTDPETKEWKQSYNIKIEITEVGTAGIDTDSLRYLWVENSVIPPAIDEFVNSFIAEDTTVTDGIVTQLVSHINTPTGETGDNWTLWILVEDSLGEANIAASQLFQLDNAKPVMQITTGDNPSIEEVCKSTDVTISFNETHAGLAEGTDIGFAEGANSYQYYLSTNANALEGGKWFDYTKGAAFTIGQDDGNGNPITGRRYLFVKTVRDKSNNESNLSVSSNIQNTDSMTGQAISGTTDSLEIDANSGTQVTIDGTEYHRFGDIVAIDGVNYHRFGEFIFDNTEPEITIQYNEGVHDIYEKSQTTTVTIRDNTDNPSRGEAGVDTTTLKYQWNQSSEVPTEESFDTATYKGTFTTLQTDITSPEGVTGNNWYLWILAKDNVGNTNIVTTEGQKAFYLDNTNPTISIQSLYPENQNIDISGTIVTRYADITLTTIEEHAKLAEGTDVGTAGTANSYQYYLSTSNTEITGGKWFDYTLTADSSLVTRTASFRIGQDDGNGNPITGTRYLFIKRITDKAGNTSTVEGTLVPTTNPQYHLMGTYVFDNTVPDVTIPYDENIHAVYEQSQSISVTVNDNTDELPNAGIDFANSLVRYEWTNDVVQPVTKDEFTNTMTSSTQSLIIAGYTGYRYLWIYAEDNIGNSCIVYPKDAEGNPLPFYLDNTKPIMNQAVVPVKSTTNSDGNDIWTSAEVTITFTEEHAGMVETANDYQYYLSTSSSQLQGGTLQNYTAGTEFEIGNAETGDRYLFVKAVTDKAGNITDKSEIKVTINGNEVNKTLDDVVIDGVTYHVFGIYKFDNTAPSVEATYADTHNEYHMSQTVNVTLRDDNTKAPETGEAGVKLSEVRYLWSKNQAQPANKDAFPAENTITSLNQDITKDDETGIFYLWLYVEDELGNNKIVGITDEDGNLVEFWVDITSIELRVDITADPTTSENVWKTANVNVTATDTESGINTNRTYKYFLSSSSTTLQDITSGTFEFETDGNINTKVQNFEIGIDLTATRYLFIENIFDNAGNATLKEETTPIFTINGGAEQVQFLENVTITEGENAGTYHVFGYYTNANNSEAYKFDNSEPKVNITTSDPDTENPNWSREHTATVELVDVGLAGLDTSTFKYIWVNEEELTDAEKIVNKENLTAEEQAQYEALFTAQWNRAEEKEKPIDQGGDGVSNLKGTFTDANTTITTPEDNLTELISGSDWYLWILAKDKLGNTVVAKSTPVHLDNEVPKFKAEPETAGPVKSVEITITSIEEKSGLRDDNMRQYFLSSSDTDLVGGSYKGGTWTDYTSGESFTLGEDITGTYYLYVKQIVDKAGNVSTIANSVYKETVTITEGENAGTYHKYGPYIFDNSSPIITVDPETTTNEDAQDGKAVETQEVVITVQDIGDSGLVDETTPETIYQYAIIAKDTMPNTQTEWKNYQPQIVSGEETDTRRATITIGENLTGEYDLFIKSVSDKLGNVSAWKDSEGNLHGQNGQIVEGDSLYHKFGTYVFDNSGPSITVNPETTTSDVSDDGKAVLSQDIRIILADIGTAGLASTTGEYYLSSSATEITDKGTAVTSENFESGEIFTIGAGKTGEYYLYVKPITDKLGHLSAWENSDGTLHGQYGEIIEVTGTNAGIYHRFGPYIFDNSAPLVEFEPNENTTWKQTHTVNVNVEDIGTSGLTENLRFVWVDMDNLPEGLTITDEESFNRACEIVPVDEKGNELTNYKGTFKLGDTISSPGKATGNNWVLWILAKDNLGQSQLDNQANSITDINTVIASSGAFWLDNIKPKIEAVPNHADVCREVEITLESIEEHSGLKDATYEYYLSSSETALVDCGWGGWTEYQSLQPFTIGRDVANNKYITGETWLFLKVLNDNAGNESDLETAAIQEIDGQKYHKFGPYIFDNTAPTVSIETQYSPEAGIVNINGEDITVCEYADITLTTFDSPAKLDDENNIYQYYLSTSETEITGGKWFDFELQPLPDETTGEQQDTRTATFRIGLDDGNGNPITDDIGKGRYLFVRRISDKVGNISEKDSLGNNNLETVQDGGNNVEYHYFGKYVFDNDKTTIKIEPNQNETWQQNHNPTVTITDRGNAGVDPSTLKYLWTQDDTELTTEEAFLTAYNSAPANNKGEFRMQASAQEVSQVVLSPVGENGDNWKLWIIAKDILQHVTTGVSGNFWLDNTSPTITINTVYPAGQNITLTEEKDGEPAGTVVTKSADITLTTFEEHSKLDDDNNSYQYYLSTSNTEITGGKWFDYTLSADNSLATRTATFTIGLDDGTEDAKPITGVRYLFVKTIADKTATVADLSEPNVSKENGTIITEGNIQYHLMGKYVFDNTNPEVTFNPEGESEWAKSHATEITVRDDNSQTPATGLAGVDTTSLKYQWIKGNSIPTEESFTTSFTNPQTIARALGTGNDWYLWILAKDNVGNTTMVTTNPFWLDNTKPIIENMTSKPSSASTYTLTMSGIADNQDVEIQSGVYGYYISTNATAPTEDSTWVPITDTTVTYDEQSGTYTVTYEGALELTSYYFWVIDNVGNISEVSSLTTKEIFYSINDTSWYETFADAVADAKPSGDTIKVLKDVTDVSDGTVGDNKTIKLDTNEKTLTRNEPIVVSEGASLEIIGTGTITSSNSTQSTILSQGTLKITSGVITSEGYLPLVAQNSGNIEIAGGTITKTSTAKATIAGEGTGTIKILGGTVEGNIYAGNGTVDLVSGTVNGNIHGGKIQGTADNSNIILEGATITGDIYGGGDATDKVNNVNITLQSGSVRNVFGGGLNNSQVGTANIVLNGDPIIESNNIYGGANTIGTVDNAIVDIKSGTLANVYGGGTQGGTTLNTTVIIESGAVITENVYGGAHKATVGNTTDNSGSTTINIVGGTIEGNIYGGSDTDPIYGETNINIGKDAVGDNTLNSGEITILGNIYGGGHQDKTVVDDEEEPEDGTEEEEIPDFTEVSVKNGTHINIDGNGATINFGGDIFGTGERITYEGASTITIKNLGTSGNPYLINSIQRTGTLTIDNSQLEIIGKSDSSNLNVEASYTLNRIDRLNVQNGTYLYLRRGFNVVGELHSLTSDGSKASVTISEGAVTGRNVDNRIYVYEGVNLFIAKEEYSKTVPISEYGKVNGMTFFGMYTRDRSNGNLKYDVYDPTNPTSSKTFIISSYIEGKYDPTQAITVDGFYTNALEDEDVENSPIITRYINVITAEPVYQDWVLGEKVYTQEVTMIAQRNKERVYQSIPLESLNQVGAEYEVKLFSVNSFEPDIELVSRTQIPRVAATPEIANTTFALTMKNGSGWQNEGETQFYTSGNPIQGTTTYISDYSGNAPYIDFYLYNSINITETKDCGFANLVFVVRKTTNGDASEGTLFKVAVSINIQTIGEIIEGEFQTDSRITDGKNFGLFSENEIFITDRSSMTTYFNMYPLGTYDDTEYRVLSSTCQLPIGTQITMVDYGEDENYPKVYYYEVTNLVEAEQETGRYIYNFSDFILMSSITQEEGATAAEDEAAHFQNNNLAYSASGFEEYKILIDFKNATITQDLLEQNIRFELRDSNNIMKNYEILPTQFNIYADKRSDLSLQVTKDTANVYDIIESGNLTFTIKSIMTTQSVSVSTVVDDIEETIVYPIEDTYFDEKKLGMAISLYDQEGNKLPYEKVRGIYYVVDGQEYYPDLTGTARWYLADNIVTVEKTVKMYIEGGLLESGAYQVRIENFASDNGTYFGISGDNQDNTTINIIDLDHGLKVEITDEDRLVDAETGKTFEGDTQMNIGVTASDIVANTNIRVSLYKRDITYNEDLSYAGVSYTLVDLANYVSDTLEKPEDISLNSSNSHEYIVTNAVTEQTLINYMLNLNNNLLTGGYKLQFSIYSGDNCLGTVDRHFVVTDLVTIE